MVCFYISSSATLRLSSYTISSTSAGRMDQLKREKEEPGHTVGDGEIDHGTGELLNASGHVQELRRHFSLWSLAGVGITVGNVWPAVGGSILVALYNGGPPGMLGWRWRRRPS